ncbi:hypothetical protein A2Z00_00430 [Candidatus Gottesmanbacteria bacterium RBG_13_45_10]|uniref:TrpR like protein, YerC/YecD n=1 Tax=Candidatus Gottesmanbacteria bacterium RBG_13_45_10 TaxID=1798370 RepID=A0A1F5ZGY7_9BACT|nr:MAG: hypothetical protein A2Z00_00430 [Candidatus Gottesmanbacteria bacterium RBG_13_45_10]
MTQVSRRKLSRAIQNRIYTIFTKIITDVRTQSEVEALLEDFLTPTERVMLPKRLCIAFLLLKGYSHRTIASYLNVSFTTINRVSTALQVSGKGYQVMLTRMQHHEELESILEKIEEGVLGVLAATGGPSRVWRSLQQEHRKEKSPRTPF